MIPYSRPKLSDLYTLSQSKLLENHTLHSGTYLYSPYMTVPPPPLDHCLVLESDVWFRSFSSSKNSHFQHEAKWKTFVV